ncbi:MAG: bifunctional glutamate N-acetyltransferase/amino-acid acetyltransferase ArgJ [Spirochaetaceae bacterium]|jgi:glutamate N-acetyltransferase/amino-acid N-acetyltransferase|nr:bifunctional glutamate N-acetyltransferase/amino-acid acetyltransferase ArgJ [Spirochaetaceae bacterium]
MKRIDQGVCAPQGFLAGGIRCGIKGGSAKRDLALVYSTAPCASAALFTTNRVKAASIGVSQEHLAKGSVRGVIANSGNANACTGAQGMAAARRMAELAGEALDISPEQMAVASTGVIGVPLPIETIAAGMPALKAALRADAQGHEAALEAIMTTDTRKKAGALEIDLAGTPVRLGGMVKGSGMIHPNLGTMLCFITTDACISPECLDAALRRAVQRSFNRVTVDGDTSTNDMVLLLANGQARNSRIHRPGPEEAAFREALESLCIALARDMARDGEGATKLLTVTVRGTWDEESAALLAKSVASSSLVKAACFGADANWGRVLCALGYAGLAFDPHEVAVAFASPAGQLQVCRQGMGLPFSEEKAKEILLADSIEIIITLGQGPGEAQVWGCDLSYEYVKINGDYRS